MCVGWGGVGVSGCVSFPCSIAGNRAFYLSNVQYNDMRMGKGYIITRKIWGVIFEYDDKLWRSSIALLST